MASNMVNLHSTGLLACPDCDLLQSIPALAPGATARCGRCGHAVAFNKPDSLDRTLALALAAAFVLIVANVMPLMDLSVSGRTASTTIIGGAMEMWIRGEKITALLVAFCTVVAPAIHIGIMLAIVLNARKTPAPSWVGTLLRWSHYYEPWGMIEVMMLGIMVALIKIAELATVLPGLGMFAAGALVILVPAITVSFDPQEVWKRVVWADGEPPPEPPGFGPVPSGKSAPKLARILTGMRLGLVSCEFCGLLSKPADIHEPGNCPRCGAELEMRKHNTIQRSWALLIAAFICYIPANVLPVMVSTTFVGTEDDTILSGVVLLYKTGSWHLALIVLIASVIIPLAKIFCVGYLLVSVQRRSIKDQRDRMKLYRIVEFVGRWSMLDVFVVTFTVALIQLQPLMSIKPGTGVLFFAGVVVLTMIAAESFEPRLIWDSSGEKGGPNE